MRKQIVVAKYTEDMAWLRDVPWPTVVYDKCPSVGRHHFPHVQYIELDNHPTGREAHSYATHIVRNYYHLDDLTFFLQGDPFPHSDGVWRALRTEPSETLPISSINQRGFEQAKIDLGMDDPMWKCFHRKEPIPTSFFTKDTDPFWRWTRWRSLFGKGPCPRKMVYGYGAQFAVPKIRIRQRPLGFYTRLLKLLEQYDYGIRMDAWFMETAWLYVFGDVHPGGFPDRLRTMPPRCMA